MVIMLPNARAVVLASLLAIIGCPFRGPLTAAAENAPPAAEPEQPLILVESVKPIFLAASGTVLPRDNSNSASRSLRMI
jgi:hypothetical protein